MNRNREWKKMLIPYEQAVEEMKVKLKSIRNEYRDMSEYSPIEFVTGRVKKISSILEKAKRRNIPEDQIEEMIEDIAGLRIMCQFSDDIYKVVELLRNRDGKDLKIVYEKDYIKNTKTSGYKSYHVVIRYPVQTAFGEREILVEIQIRTLAMNFWATIEHSLNYKYNKKLPDKVRDRLKKAATAAAELDKDMCEIRNEVINAQLLFEGKSNMVADIVKNIKVLRDIGESEKADLYRSEFENLWDDGTIYELEELLVNIKNELPRYKMFSTGKGKDV